MNNVQLCQHGCGQTAIHQTKSSLLSGPFRGKPVWQCAKSHNACPAIKDKKIATSIKNFGTAYPQQNKDHMEKIKSTNIEKYGHACSLKNEAQQAKRKATMLERYGVVEPTLNKEIRNKAALAVKQSYINDITLSKRQIESKRKKYGDDFTSIVNKNRETQIANGRWVDPSKRSEWSAYKFKVKQLTSRTYKKYKNIINPNDLKIGVCDYQVDHIYSIRHGFENSVDPAIISDIANLRLLWHTDNKSKHIRSDITLEDLMAKIKGA